MRIFLVILLIINITVLFVDYCIACDNWREFNVKVGFQFAGKIKIEYKNPDPDEKDETLNLNSGFIFSGEFLIPCEYFSESVENFKFGMGFSYLFPRDYKRNANVSISYFPVYFTLQVNPFIGVQNKVFHGIFLKGNVGYNFLFDFKDKGLYNNSKIDKTGGLYYAFSEGYEFPFGLVIDLSYTVYRGSIKILHYNDTSASGGGNYFANDDLIYRDVTFNIGYKFKV
jgi:hypothetical protein